MENIIFSIDEISMVTSQILNALEGKNGICLYGEMGSGKTTLIKEIVKQLNSDDYVTSPTYSIVNEYQTNSKKIIYHFDFFRIVNEEEFLNLGFEEYFHPNSICLVEWPEKVEKYLDDNMLKIHIFKSENKRTIKML